MALPRARMVDRSRVEQGDHASGSHGRSDRWLSAADARKPNAPQECALSGPASGSLRSPGLPTISLAQLRRRVSAPQREAALADSVGWSGGRWQGIIMLVRFVFSRTEKTLQAVCHGAGAIWARPSGQGPVPRQRAMVVRAHRFNLAFGGMTVSEVWPASTGRSKTSAGLCGASSGRHRRPNGGGRCTTRACSGSWSWRQAGGTHVSVVTIALGSVHRLPRLGRRCAQLVVTAPGGVTYQPVEPRRSAAAATSRSFRVTIVITGGPATTMMFACIMATRNSRVGRLSTSRMRNLSLHESFSI